jgi:hypothetical protein
MAPVGSAGACSDQCAVPLPVTGRAVSCAAETRERPPATGTGTYSRSTYSTPGPARALLCTLSMHAQSRQQTTNHHHRRRSRSLVLVRCPIPRRAGLPRACCPLSPPALKSIVAPPNDLVRGRWVSSAIAYRAPNPRCPCCKPPPPIGAHTGTHTPARIHGHASTYSSLPIRAAPLAAPRRSLCCCSAPLVCSS